MDDSPKRRIGLPEVLGFLVILAASKCLIYSWVPPFELFIGLGGSLLASLALAGISTAIWKTPYSWRVILGLSGILSLLSLMWLLWVNRATL